MPSSTRRSFMRSFRTSFSLGAEVPVSWSTLRETQRPQLAVRMISLGELESELASEGELEEKINPPQ